MDTATKELLDSLGSSSEGAADTTTPAPPATANAYNPSSHYAPGQSTSIEDRALALLGSGIPNESVAAALGVTPSRISQLLSDEDFSKRVGALRYEGIQKFNIRDGHYDHIEDQLLVKLEKAIPLMFKPTDILNALKVTNSAKRRGQSSPQQVTNQQNIVNLILPKIILEKFTINIDNQVIRAGDQDLTTMASSNLLRNVEEASANREAALEHKPEES